jgi:DNA invertase Pin-like site-specific DNA recombinase
MKAALYLRVSTTDQSVENQRRELQAVADRMGHDVIEIYADNGVSGAKGRDKRPGFDRLLWDAARRKFDLVMAWSVDRLGRSLQDCQNNRFSCKISPYLYGLSQSHVEGYNLWVCSAKRRL